ncbi:TatD family deoxyribonuclease [Flavobacterium silvisoli]|uniref:TatD family deoxyribonuclease n=1 Tax=Flavobacterium silvisoli TaxID=2529433 RepID=A0A4Q9Z6B8_9FLAO|nr:TatD family hydrolase [Flavobacterium silvisoli]TBX70099.1 TatD family deoxyribonuclease [Flavobacterium silvisoli]
MSYFNLHTHKYTNRSNVLELVNQYPWAFDETIPQYSIGIHPWYIDESRLESDLQLIDKKLALPECLALGECGLDKRITIPIDLQAIVFERQITLAEKHQKPLVLHLVAAYQELIEIKKRLHITVPVILHGFSKNEQVAKQLLDNGCYLSFGKYLLRNPDLKDVFLSVPDDRFFLETDTMEESLEEVYAVAAEYRGISVHTLQQQVLTNRRQVFGV